MRVREFKGSLSGTMIINTVKEANNKLRIGINYKILVLLTLFSSFAQITLGGYVRSSKSGLGCPDWPLCYGKIIPDFNFHTLIEWSHRVNASVLIILISVMFAITLAKYKNINILKKGSFICLIIVITAAILGGITVITELSWWVRLIHLGLAQALIAVLTILACYSWTEIKYQKPSAELFGKWKNKTIFLLSILYILILSGSYMVGTGASSACATWPLCRGEIFPSQHIYAIHMLHRYIAAIALISVLYISYSFYKNNIGNKTVKKAFHAVIGSMALQIVTGAVLIWSGFSADFKTIHLSVATLVWVSAVYLTTVVWHSSFKN